ncbi:M56 family metallopeptidase [Phosphitispora fastidiosa]|uniref:M56 family metallopeptidase n=1 Tax=Phosphitispora fastidiosa TaxID=2837202 RepID=UPI001E4DED88|nr:M56 family metallopeptidase [Phosphitispora fastidiosa]MBU7005965.1 beta-lactamase regulating signal transducer with metallopeptidase domain [Phosphitispora fastidiosa]
MNETVRLLLSLSLSGSILGLLILVLKPLIKHRVPKSIQYYIWLIVLLRLVTPFSPENSLMNDVFYSSGPAGETNPAGVHNPEEVNSQTGNQSGIPFGVRTGGRTGEHSGISLTIPNIKDNADRGVYNNDADHIRYLQDLFTQYVIYLWLLGVVIAITVNLAGYIRFLHCLRQGYREATDDENSLLAALLRGRKRVRLLRNKFVPTPMLIGIWRPCIIIPDVDFDEKQLKNILLHEVTHLRRFDIQVKWLTMTAASIHWFNPLVYLFKRKINQACELACDEAVINNLSPAEKQAYGDTLISVIAEHKYPVGVLQATMSEEKKSLQERLVAIMKHHQKSRQIIILSGVLLAVFLFGAIYLGAGVGTGAASPPNLYIAAEGGKTKAALKGSYSWTNGKRHIQADSDHPVNFVYSLDNTVSVTGKEQLILDTRKTKNDKQYDFTIEDLTVYKDKQPVDFAAVEPGFMNRSLYLQAPPNPGEYIYVLILNIKDDKGKAKGTVSYGLVVRVDMMTYNLAEYPREVIDLVENNLEIIMSSPKESSNPMDYIKAHQNEYEAIIKYSYSYNNEEVLTYMLSQFEEGNAEGLRGHLLMGLCKELLGERNNVTDESLSPMQWYEQYDFLT